MEAQTRYYKTQGFLSVVNDTHYIDFSYSRDGMDGYSRFTASKLFNELCESIEYINDIDTIVDIANYLGLTVTNITEK